MLCYTRVVRWGSAAVQATPRVDGHLSFRVDRPGLGPGPRRVCMRRISMVLAGAALVIGLAAPTWASASTSGAGPAFTASGSDFSAEHHDGRHDDNHDGYH